MARQLSTFRPGGSLDRRVKLSLRVPAQMGWHEMEHKGGKTRLVLSCAGGMRP
jgi:predicted RNA methylase